MRTEIVARLTAAAPGRIAILGELTRHDLAFVYAASDLFVWPAVNEAFGMALVEAQAAGLPVVAGNERGVPDIVLSAVTGLLPPARDSRAFADAIRRLIEDDALRAKFSLSAMQRARERFDISAAARDIDRALTAALLALRDRKVSGAA
jgi:glycosyltransferase involved in cell wall biosynthesis